MTGLLLTIEGCEGTGKSTQLQRLVSKLNSKGITNLVTKQPGGSPLCKDIRKLLLTTHSSGEELSHKAELLLFYADRVQHITSTILPALQRYEIVLCDRFDDSSWAYQGTRGVPKSVLKYLRQFTCENLPPFHTILLDVDVELGLKRVFRRNSSIPGFDETRFDNETISFHKAVRKAFLSLAKANPNRIQIIDATPNPDVVAASIWAHVSGLLESKECL